LSKAAIQSEESLEQMIASCRLSFTPSPPAGEGQN
jgi:hypothetical protein